MVTKEDVISALKKVFDPELGVDIVELGLVYDVKITDGSVHVNMTMTSPMCPAAMMIIGQAEQAVRSVKGVTSADVDLVWEPAWSPERMSDDAKLKLGMM